MKSCASFNWDKKKYVIDNGHKWDGREKWTVVRRADVAEGAIMAAGDINSRFPKTSVAWKGLNDRRNFIG